MNDLKFAFRQPLKNRLYCRGRAHARAQHRCEREHV
jgi:hypothetical protein